MLEFGADPGPVALTTATLTADEGLRKHYRIEREDVSLVKILSEVGSDRDLKDVALHEPDIEEVIRTFYQRRNADQRSNAKARAS
jgi:ABC-2 type transport system ATP-binding protein